MDEPRRGLLLVGLAAVLWSTGGLLVRLIDADEPSLIFWRSVFAAGFLLAYLAFDARRDWLAPFRQLGWAGLAVSVMLSLDAILFILALNRTSVANVVFIFSTTPFAAALLAWAVLREPVAARTWGAMCACAAGVFVMVSGSLGRSTLTGDLLALAVAVLFAVPVVIIRRHPGIRMMPAVLLSAALSALFCLPFATLAGHSARDFVLLGAFGVVEFGVATVLFTLGARYIPAAQTTLIGLLETVLAPLWVWLVVQEQPGPRTLAGGAIVLATLLAYSARDLLAGGAPRMSPPSSLGHGE